MKKRFYVNLFVTFLFLFVAIFFVSCDDDSNSNPKTDGDVVAPVVDEDKVEDTDVPVVDEDEIEDADAPVVDEDEIEDADAPVVDEDEMEDADAPLVDEDEMEDADAPVVDEDEMEDADAPVVDEDEMEDADVVAGTCDISGYYISQFINEQVTYVFPSDTVLDAGEVILLTYSSTKAEFEAALNITLPDGTRVFNAEQFYTPIIEKDQIFTLKKSADEIIDGPTFELPESIRYFHRKDTALDAGLTTSWYDEDERTPGSLEEIPYALGATTASKTGRVIITEIGNTTGNTTTHYLELYCDK